MVSGLTGFLLFCPLYAEARKKFLTVVGAQQYTNYYNFIRNILQDERRLRALITFFEETRTLRPNRLQSLLGRIEAASFPS